MAEATALASKHQIRPLPFQPTRLKGLSERLVVSHHENNYGGAVRNLNRVEEEAVTRHEGHSSADRRRAQGARADLPAPRRADVPVGQPHAGLRVRAAAARAR